MALPAFGYAEQDPGIGFTRGGGDRFLFIGCSSLGTANEIVDVPRTADVVALLGQGPLPEALAYANAQRGQHGPHFAMRLTGGVAAAWTAVTKVAGHAGPTITLSATPYDRYDWQWQTQGTGALGVGRGRYTLDGGYSWSPTITIPSGGSYLMENTNTTITFPSGTYTAGQSYTATSTEPFFSTTNLASGVTAMLAATTKLWDGIFLIGAPADAVAGAAMFSALDTHLGTLETALRYNGAIMDVGIDSTADVVTNFAPVTSTRITPFYGNARVSTAKPFLGWGKPMLSGSIPIAGRAASSLVSEALFRVASGQLKGISHTNYDEFVSGALNDTQIATFRTWPTKAGFYVSFDHIKSAAGSDFIGWPLRRVADRAARIVSGVMVDQVGENFPTNPDKTILDTAANSLEEKLNAALRAELVARRDKSGKNSHVSDIFCQVDRSNPYATDRTINVTTLIRPSQAAEQVLHTLGFTSGSVTGETLDEPPTEPEE